MKKSVLIVSALFLSALWGPLTFADTDLSVSNVGLSTQGEYTYVSFDIGILIDENQSDYAYDITISRLRNGTTTTLGFFPDIGGIGGGATNCLTCVSSCSGSCKYKHNGTQYDGTCEDNGLCTSGSTKHCICSGGDSKSILLGTSSFQSGDVITVTITPEDGVTELLTSNNAASAVY